MKTLASLALCCCVLHLAASPSAAQRGRDDRRTPPPPPVISPDVGQNGSVTFRLRAPQAESVRLSGSDLPQSAGREFEQQDGVWTLTLEDVPPGAYRYAFEISGVRVIDPANPAVSESNSHVSSLLVVPGSELFDVRDVPHGAVSEVLYPSKSLGRTRRMHVYTPPGYESGEGRYPVLYLLHGATDSDDSWSSLGRAGFILDNLIAAGRAKPMIVVMPHGHTGPFVFGEPGGLGRQVEEFVTDFEQDLRPFVESRYRLIDDRNSRAIAGLSMGGYQTLELMIRNLSDFGYVGVFSSGIFGSRGPRDQTDPGPEWAEKHKAAFANEEARQELKLLWVGIGTDDFLLEASRRTVKLLQDRGFNVTYVEGEGGHAWPVWREYLGTFVPQLFQ